MKEGGNSESKLIVAAEILSLIIVIGIFLNQTFFVSQITVALKNLAAVLPGALVEMTNTSRSEQSLGRLEINPLLVQSAQMKANDMAAKGYFAHQGPDGSTPWDYIDAVGYHFIKAGENLAVNYVDSLDVHRAWLRSPTHRANILNENFEEIGIATAEGTYNGRKAIFVVQHFGTLPQKVEPAAVSTIEVVASAPIEQEILGAAIEESEQEPVEVTIEVSEEAPQEATIIFEENPEQTFVATERELSPEEFVVYAAEDENDEVSVAEEDVTELTKVLSSPRSLMTLVFILLTFVISLKVLLAMHVRHPRMIALGIFLILIIVVLFILNNYMSLSGAAIV